eukprot:COSAG02_NODE_4050_length_5849_cov_4.000522_2_plen_414_part_00
MTGAVLASTDTVPNHALRNSILEHFQAADRQLSPLKPQTPEAKEQPVQQEVVDPDAERSLQEAEQQLQSLDEYVSTVANAAAPVVDSDQDIAGFPVEDEVVRLFNQLDVDCSGVLNQTELYALARKLGSAMTEDEIEKAMEEMDPDRSGGVDLAEFMNWWSTELQPEPKLDTTKSGLSSDGSFVGTLPSAIDIEAARPGTARSKSNASDPMHRSGELTARSTHSRASFLSALTAELEVEANDKKEMDWSVFEDSWHTVTSGLVFFEDPAEVKEIVSVYLRKMSCPVLGSIQIREIEEMFDGWINNTRLSGASGVAVGKAFDVLEAGAKVSAQNQTPHSSTTVLLSELSQSKSCPTFVSCCGIVLHRLTGNASRLVSRRVRMNQNTSHYLARKVPLVEPVRQSLRNSSISVILV